jgi:hypothetical protein
MIKGRVPAADRLDPDSMQTSENSIFTTCKREELVA